MTDWTDLDDLDRAPTARAPAAAAPSTPCPSCSGSGRWRSPSGASTGPCFTCQGTGQVTPGRIRRQQAARRGRVTAASNKAARIAAWRAEHPDAAAWLDADRPFPFRDAMRDALTQWGALTDNQLAAVRRCIAADTDRAERRATERTALAASAPQLGDSFGAIKDALDRAASKGLRAPSMRTGLFTFSRAPNTGANPGAIYVKARSGDAYLGKIVQGGRFLASRECTPELTAALVTVAADPLAAAVAYGRQFGLCSCCGRDLSDPASVAAGIGPICASKYF
jgi:hypothetical protein